MKSLSKFCGLERTSGYWGRVRLFNLFSYATVSRRLKQIKQTKRSMWHGKT
jgi:hypothetical protein